jgi:hypothetical protein
VRAFGPPAAVMPSVNGEEVLETARHCGLGPRIGGRVSRDQLGAELGAAAAAGFRRLYVATAERAVVLAGLARLVGEVAAGLGVQVALLKGAALHAAGIVAPGLRPAVDVDVLASPRSGRPLHRALQRYGLAPLAGADCEAHHLRPLRHACGRRVEVHERLAGVGSHAGADAESLVKAGRLIAAKGYGAALIPDRAFLAAHLLVHALALHGDRPADYPQLRLLGDLIDLLPTRDAWRAFDSAGAALVRPVLGAADCRAAEDLCLALAEGTIPAGPAWRIESGDRHAVTGLGGAESLLRHLIAGQLDRDYAAALKLSSFLRRPGGLPAPLAVVRRAWQVTVLTRAQVGSIYGPQPNAWSYLRRQLWRPFDLVGRTVRAIRTRRRLRRQSVG